MDFRATSRRVAERMTPESRSHIFISVSTPGSDPADLSTGPNTLGILRLWFDDLDRPPAPSTRAYFGRPIALFTRAQARQILDFVAAHPRAEVVVAHCDMGASRSPAICAALAKIYDDDDMWWFERYRPNTHVFRTLFDEHFFATGPPEA